MSGHEQLSADLLVEGCGDASFHAGLSIASRLEPLAGYGAPVKPAVYEGGSYQHDVRWRGEGDARRRTDAIVIDNVPSQANRIEAALRTARARLGLPELLLDLSEFTDLPVHVERSISSFTLPHRNADAYLRDAALGGTPFPKTELGKSLFLATGDNPDALVAWMPQALLFGFWQSHLGKKGPQSKLARSWVSEIVGFDPASTQVTLRGLKGDPLNLSIDDAVEFDEQNLLSWSAADGKKSGKSKSKESLSEIGHGQVPVSGAPAGVSFSDIEQMSSLSLAGLRKLRLAAEGRALVAAVGLAGHVFAFARAMSLRSGCELRPVEQRWTWRGDTSDLQLAPLDAAAATTLVRDCLDRAKGAGLNLDGWDHDPIVLKPGAQLAAVITKAYPHFEGF
jgi:CRISPR-associated protein Csb1